MAGPFSPADPRHYLGIGVQGSKGTGVAPTLFVPYLGELSHRNTISVTAQREGGAGFSAQRHTKDIYTPGGGLATPLRPSTAAQLVAYCLGVDSISGAGPYLHTITPDADVDWLSIERNIGDEQIERLVDSVISEVVIDIRKRDQGAEMRVEGTYIGLTPDRQAAATAIVLESTDPFLRSQCVWAIDSVAAKTNVESCRITMTWRYDEGMMADAVTRNDLAKLDLSVGIELVQQYNSSDEVDAYRATHYGTPTGTAAAEGVYKGDLEVVVTAGADIFDIDIPDVAWTDAVLTEPNPEGNEATRITRTGMAEGPSASLLTIDATNGDSAAYIT